MDKERATMLCGYLVGATTGWNDEAVTIYVSEFEKLNDVDALGTALQNIARSWKEPRRPPIATILDQHRTELSRRSSAHTALPTTKGKQVMFSDGVEIARAAYEQECRRLGNKPDVNKFDRWLTK